MKRLRTSPSRTRRAATLIESMVAIGIFGFVVAAVGLLFSALLSQQRMARDLSRGLSDLRAASETFKRVGRHARIVDATPSFGNARCGSNQLLVEVPEPTGSAQTSVQIRVYVDNGTLYKQRDDEEKPGTALLENVATVSYRYYHNDAGTRTELPGTLYGRNAGVDMAREVEATFVVRIGDTTVRSVETVLLRNVAATR